MSDILGKILESMVRKVDAGHRSEPDQFHVAAHKLRRGLALSLELDDDRDRYTLTLSRSGINPSDEEVAICCAALQIGGAFAQVRRGRYYRKGSPIIYAARLSWPRMKQSTLLEKNNGS
jgi:hypothetical protein